MTYTSMCNLTLESFCNFISLSSALLILLIHTKVGVPGICQAHSGPRTFCLLFLLPGVIFPQTLAPSPCFYLKDPFPSSSVCLQNIYHFLILTHLLAGSFAHSFVRTFACSVFQFSFSPA